MFHLSLRNAIDVFPTAFRYPRTLSNQRQEEQKQRLRDG